jgi:hypothetical protein
VATAAFLSEAGAVCGTCFVLIQNEQAQVEAKNQRLSESLTKRAWYVGGVHAIWLCMAIIAAGEARLPGWLSSLLIAAGLVLPYALRLRWRSAFVTAAVLDVAGLVACLAWGAVSAVRGSTPLVAVLGVFPLAMLGFLWGLRGAYVDEADPENLRQRGALSRWLVPVTVTAALAGLGFHLVLRPRVDPARHLIAKVLPAWEAVRGRSGTYAGGPWGRDLVAGARRWPAVATALETLDRVWPEEAPVRDAVRGLNGALAGAALPYAIDVWMVNGRPILLTHTLLARVPWRIGDRTVDVLRLRRLDELNVELGLLGATTEGLPAVMVDRVEAELTRDVRAMFGKHEETTRPASDDFDAAVLARQRAWLEARTGPGFARAGAGLIERDRLLEQMRARLNGGSLMLLPPDGFFLGEAWLAKLEPLSDLTREGGRKVLAEDLASVARADEALRGGETAQALAAAAELLALSTEAHEARHALDEAAPVGPPPPQLFQVMEGASTPMVGAADKELRAILGELHDAPAPACLTLARVMRMVYGKGARATPHHFATLAILGQVDRDPTREPAQRLAALCAIDDAELRRRVADAWQNLYRAPMPAAQRLASR